MTPNSGFGHPLEQGLDLDADALGNDLFGGLAGLGVERELLEGEELADAVGVFP